MRMLQRFAVASALLAWVSLLALPALGQAPQSVFGPWLGTYESAGPEGQATIDAAIEEGTNALGPLKRRIARKRLKAVNQPYKQIRIYQVGDVLVTDFEGRRYSAPVTGEAAEGVDPEGKKVTVSYRPEGRTLHARFVAEDGEKRIDFELDESGAGLAMHVTVRSGRLPEPIRYTLNYGRAR
jgi:hypothetical protein